MNIGSLSVVIIYINYILKDNSVRLLLRLYSTVMVFKMKLDEICQYFASLGERIGALTVITKDGQKCPEIRSQVEQCIMKIWSFPPAHGSRVFTRVLNDDVLCKKWQVSFTELDGKIMII